jgi:hypothetical protein
LPIELVTEVQRWSVVEQIDLLNGIRLPVLFILDPASTNLGRDSIFGLITESRPSSRYRALIPPAAIMSSKTYKIDQRL